jgi:hypothetical protein
MPEEAQRQDKPSDGTRDAVSNVVKQELRLALAVGPDVELGVHSFRLQTPLGTSNLGVFDVGALPEIREKEPNDSLIDSQHVELPCTIVGDLQSVGDVDSFQFNGLAGQELVFQVIASALGSGLQSVLVLRNSMGTVLARAGDLSSSPDAVLTAKLPTDGKYTISLSDFGLGGGRNYFYRLNAGSISYLAEVFPLGLRAGQSTDLEVEGSNLAGVHKVTLQGPPPAEGWFNTIPFRLKTSQGETLNELRLAVGNNPEIIEQEPNNAPSEAQTISIPVTINGHISGNRKSGLADEDYFRFHATTGQHLIVEVAAARLGSPLDSRVEVLDANGREIPQAVVRSLREYVMPLYDRDSQIPGFELDSFAGLHLGDYLMVGDELVQITFIPGQLCSLMQVRSYRGERIALLNTSPRAHLIGTPVYKAQVLDPGNEPPANGLPVFHLTYQNDDGGPGYGQDSRLDFTAPQNGFYLLRISDARGIQGANFAYRLSIREFSQDFTLAARPTNPNVPRGGRLGVRVDINRTLGYQGPVKLQVEGLPRGVTASATAIVAGQDSAMVILAADEDASTAEPSAPFRIVGRAKIDGLERVSVADFDQLLPVVSVTPATELLVTAEPHELILEAGGRTRVTVHVERRNGLRGQVACAILNLPPGIQVEGGRDNTAVLLENETSRTLTLRAEEGAIPIEQPVYIEGASGSSPLARYVSIPFVLKVAGRHSVRASGPPAPTQ